MIWGDDFEKQQLDTSKWSKITPNVHDWGRHMSADDACFKIENGKIFLRGIVNPDTLKDARKFLTGGIYSKNKFAFRYGKVEVCAKLESAKGAWPAIWMKSDADPFGSWPKSGEIDLMEHLNFDSIVYQTIHSFYSQKIDSKHPANGTTAALKPSEFNVYGMEWYPDRLVFTLNGRPTFTYPKLKEADHVQWPFDQPFYLLIDQQLGGKWVGRIYPKDLPVQMIVDWVKVYQ